IKVAFLAKATPSFAEMLAQLADSPSRRVVVQPHLLFEGELSEKIAQQVAAAAQKSDKQEWIVTPVLADPPHWEGLGTNLLQKVIRERCLQGSIRVVGTSPDD